jgi:hypothetical protein
MLQQPPSAAGEAYSELARLVLRVAHAAVAVSEAAVCAALDALGHAAVPSLEQERVLLYCELISHRGCWGVNAGGCRALAGAAGAAAATLLSPRADAAAQR